MTAAVVAVAVYAVLVFLLAVADRLADRCGEGTAWTWATVVLFPVTVPILFGGLLGDALARWVNR